MNNPANSLILASRSARRQALLKQCGVPFTIQEADIDELTGAPDIKLLPILNAELKAQAIAAKNPQNWVLGADTVVLLERELLGKPHDLAEAKQILRKLSNRTHTVFTGLALVHQQKGILLKDGCATQVTFKTLSDEVIDRYLSLVKVLDKAGAYAAQEHGDMLLAKVDGPLDNVVGLPLAATAKLLQRAGFTTQC